MAEYIDKKLLIGVLKNREECVDCTDTDCVDCMCDFIACIVPSDVAEVRHGKWIDKVHKGFGAFSGQCSECKKYSGLWTVNEPYRFCPFCGARMGDGEE